MLITPFDFKQRYFPESKRPSLCTIRRWIVNEALPGRCIGGWYFVDVVKFEAAGNDVLEKVLRDVSRSA